MASYDVWSTHTAALALAIHKYGTRVLEIGCGWYSTPMIHTLSDCALGIESNPDYVRPFETLCPGKIILTQHVVSEVFRQSYRPWDVVLIDCHAEADRILSCMFFLNRPVCIVAHDVEQPYWRPVLANVKHKRLFTLMTPNTAFLSNVIEV